MYWLISVAPSVLLDHTELARPTADGPPCRRLKVEIALDTRGYQKGIKVSTAEMKRPTSYEKNFPKKGPGNAGAPIT
jgi:hypothetical protein